MRHRGSGIRDLDSREAVMGRPNAWQYHSLVDAASFRTVLGHSPTAVCVVTTRDADECNHGITVSSYASLSLDPPLVLACIDRRARIHQVLCSATSFSISVLTADQEGVARRFSSHSDDRFAGIASSRGHSGNLLITGALAHLECDLVARHEGGDHSIIIGAVKFAQARAGRPLLHFRGAYTELAGHGESLADGRSESRDNRP
jgi:flavin reductase (DIM6/NTAB) family NADH-FMN oxidoreductase RutF